MPYFFGHRVRQLHGSRKPGSKRGGEATKEDLLIHGRASSPGDERRAGVFDKQAKPVNGPVFLIIVVIYIVPPFLSCTRPP